VERRGERRKGEKRRDEERRDEKRREEVLRVFEVVDGGEEGGVVDAGIPARP
jgi:hypothetical protein